MILLAVLSFDFVSHGLNTDSAPSCQVADALVMAEEYVEENCGELDLMSEVCIEGCGKARAKLCPIQKADMQQHLLTQMFLLTLTCASSGIEGLLG